MKNDKERLAKWISQGEEKKLRKLISSLENLNECFASGMTPLILAVEGDQPKILELLLQSGANPNFKSSLSGTTALHWAVDFAYDGMVQNNRNMPYPEPLECIRILLRHGADKNIKDDDGLKPLDYRITKEILAAFDDK